MTNSYSKSKIEDYQTGQAYLTSHRICYVGDRQERDHAVGIDLKDIEAVDFYVCLCASVHIHAL